MLASRARLIPEGRYRLSVDRPPDTRFAAEVAGRVLRGSVAGAAAWLVFVVAGGPHPVLVGCAVTLVVAAGFGVSGRHVALPMSAVCAMAAFGVLAVGPLGGFLAPACVAAIRAGAGRLAALRR
jgi:hypothetical protein